MLNGKSGKASANEKNKNKTIQATKKLNNKDNHLRKKKT